MAKKQAGKTRRNQYDEFLMATYKKTCRDVCVLGFDFADVDRRCQFHYALMEHALDSYLLFDGADQKARILCVPGCADELRSIAAGFDGKEFRVNLDESV